MQTKTQKSIATISLLVLTSLPATAQVGARIDIPLPGLEIHVGRTAPPRVRSERKPPRPDRNFLWVPGFWHWQDSAWAWIPGRWERPERGARWVRARYAREGSGWRYEPGHWSNQRVIEGDDYRRWKEDRGRGHDKDRDHDKDHEHR